MELDKDIQNAITKKADELGVVPLVDQPKPRFTLNELEDKLGKIYIRTLNYVKWHKDFLLDAQTDEEQSLAAGLNEANSMLQELIASVSRHVQDNEPIDIPKDTNKVIEQILNTEKPEFYVSGVQMVINGKIEGTSLYSTMPKARLVRDTLNKKYAELKVKYEAKIIQYPVF
jgi:hypothetical protein